GAAVREVARPEGACALVDLAVVYAEKATAGTGSSWSCAEGTSDILPLSLPCPLPILLGNRIALALPFDKWVSLLTDESPVDLSFPVECGLLPASLHVENGRWLSFFGR